MNTNDTLELLANSTDGVFAIGADNKIVFWNKSAQTILGYKAKDVLGRSYKEIIPAKGEKGNPVYFRSYDQGKSINGNKRMESFEILTSSKKSNKIWLNISVFNVPSSQSEYGMSVYVFRDITKQKIYEKIIKEVISDTEIADQLNYAIPSNKKQCSDLSHNARLTTREREILTLLADGKSTKFISSRLYIALSTLRKHIRNIYSKLRAHSMMEAVAIARKTNLI